MSLVIKKIIPYTAVVIGCGSIGAIKDDYYDSNISDAVLTHANALKRHPDINLVGVIDFDKTKERIARHKWQTTGFSSIEDMLRFIAIPDIVVIATPTETHRDVLMQVLALKPKLVVVEKPFCSTLKEAQEVHDAYTKAGIPLAVDYIRRFDPIVASVFADLRAGKYGDVQHARCLYGRGLRRDGCHGLDIFLHTLGDVRGLAFDRNAIRDHLYDDPSYTLRIEFERCREAYLVGTDSRKWGAFEMDFVTDAGVLRFSNWGKTFQHFRAAPEKTFGQYNALAASAEKIETGLTKALLYLADNCVRHLRDGEPLLCTSADAIRVHEILEAVK